LTVILVHGPPETSDIWRPLRETLHRDAVAVALPRFGIARPDGFAGTKDAYAEWLSRLYDAEMVAFRVCKDNVVMILTGTQDKCGSELEQPLHLRLLVIGIQV